MGERIVYPNHIWSPWTRCAQLSPGENGTSQSQRSGSDTASVCRADDWDKPIRWNRKAELAGVPALVRIGPRGDWFDAAADLWRPEAWEVIRKCVCLRFLISTTRPLRIAERLPTNWIEDFRHVWPGVSVEDNNDVWRVDILRKIPARYRFVSAEPLLGPLPGLDLDGIDWLVVGGESGPNFRPMERKWVRQLRDMAKASGVAFYFTQSAARRPGTGDLLDGVQCHEFPARFLEGVAQIRALHEEQERRRWEVKQLQLMEKERKKREAARKREEKQAEKALRKKFRPKVTPQQCPWRQRRRRRRRTSTYDWQHRQHDYQAEQDRREREERERQQRERQAREKKTYPQQLDDALQVLGLTRPYTLLQVKTAFRQLAKRHHPDCMGDPEKFKEAHNAYELVVKDLKVTA